VQLCVVHLVRAALKYVMDNDSDAVITDLKKIYQAATVAEAEEALEGFAQAWGDKYPTIVKQWRWKWADIVAMFDFPPAIGKAIYTTNAIESVNSVIRKFTRNRKQYPNEASALKLVYLAIHEASKKGEFKTPNSRDRDSRSAKSGPPRGWVSLRQGGEFKTPNSRDRDSRSAKSGPPRGWVSLRQETKQNCRTSSFLTGIASG
jgi:transposase-like protein